MVVGVLAAVSSGVCLPALFILFGDITNAFVYHGFLASINNDTLPDVIEDFAGMGINISENATVEE